MLNVIYELKCNVRDDVTLQANMSIPPLPPVVMETPEADQCMVTLNIAQNHTIVFVANALYNKLIDSRHDSV